MTPHSSILAWRIPRTEEPGELQCMGLRRVRYDCAINAHTYPVSYIVQKSKQYERDIFRKSFPSLTPLRVFSHAALFDSAMPLFTNHLKISF